MEQFDSLLRVAETLLGPNGCPWDQTQTFVSLQRYVLEEAHEVIEAVDSDDDKKIVEELGDLLYLIVFYAKLGEKAGRFSLPQIIRIVQEKMVRRHPHVFGEVKVRDADEVVKNWEQIKAAEKAGSLSKSVLDGIPPTLPAIVRAQKILQRMQRASSALAPKEGGSIASEQEIGEQLLALILQAENSGVDAESALRRALSRSEEAFRASEKSPNGA